MPTTPNPRNPIPTARERQFYQHCALDLIADARERSARLAAALRDGADAADIDRLTAHAADGWAALATEVARGLHHGNDLF